ncbi:MAG: hypothetical protein JWN00_1453 [Actinomycetia bacterium]|nr:hypothetical protein [Actinomycetes bacterium]
MTQFIRQTACMVLISGALLVTAILTVGTSLSTVAGELVGVGCGVVGIVGSFVIEEIYQTRLFNREIRDRQAALAEFFRNRESPFS